MSLINQIKRPINWIKAFYGLKNHYIETEDLLFLFYDKKLDIVPEENIIELEVNKSSYSDSLKIVKNIALYQSREHGLNFETEVLKSIHYWQLIFLKRIYNLNSDISQKLVEIESLWAFFNYPEEWNEFIYYMPNRKLDKNEKVVYESFKLYIENLETELE